jgi:folate-binding protein YgfZ
MSAPHVAELTGRALIHVTGEDARGFLDRLITADMDALGDGGAGYGALLTPQGKIIADFLVMPLDDGFLIDAPEAAGVDLIKRLTLYKLRAKVAIEDVSGKLAVVAVWDAQEPPLIPGHAVRDPRHPALGYRAYVARAAVGPAEALPHAVIDDEAAYHARRAGLGIPESSVDFALNDAFPHEAAMDQLHGVAFDKGCYVGQEVVSRMQHRGTARRRPVQVAADTALPPSGTVLTAGGKAIGAIGSVAGNEGVAIVRLDRAKEAIDTGGQILAGDVAVRLTLPDWAGYGWPAAGEAD